ncbi:MAG: AraC family transcriptional regulator [Alphaproteobacteria bacterium]
MLDDPLSEILAFVDARCLVAGGFTAGGRWGIRFPRPDAIKFGVLATGACWLAMEGLAAPRRLQAGDVFFVRGDRSFDLLSEVDVPPSDARQVFRDAIDGMASLGAGADVSYLGGHVELDHARCTLLLDELPALIHVARDSEQAAGLQWLAREVVAEVLKKQVGATLSTACLAQLLFVRVLRVHLDSGRSADVGWLRGLGDARIAPALALMHADPSRPWHLTELAQAVGMSRSVFAARFKSVVGSAPLGYLSAWRMRLAARALERGTEPVSQIADSLGYTSVSAFSNAFKRATGKAPKRFQSARQVHDS